MNVNLLPSYYKVSFCLQQLVHSVSSIHFWQSHSSFTDTVTFTILSVVGLSKYLQLSFIAQIAFLATDAAMFASLSCLCLTVWLYLYLLCTFVLGTGGPTTRVKFLVPRVNILGQLSWFWIDKLGPNQMLFVAGGDGNCEDLETLYMCGTLECSCLEVHFLTCCFCWSNLFPALSVSDCLLCSSRSSWVLLEFPFMQWQYCGPQQYTSEVPVGLTSLC